MRNNQVSTEKKFVSFNKAFHIAGYFAILPFHRSIISSNRITLLNSRYRVLDLTRFANLSAHSQAPGAWATWSLGGQ